MLALGLCIYMSRIPLMYFKVCTVVHILEPYLHGILNWFVNIRATPTEELRSKVLKEMKTGLRGLSYKLNTPLLFGACNARQPNA